MAEVQASPADHRAKLAEVTADMPWIHDKVAAFRGLLLAIGRNPDIAYAGNVRTRLVQAGDSEFTDPRIGLRFETQESMGSVWHGRAAIVGYPTYGTGKILERPVSRELIEFVDAPAAYCFWTRHGDGLLVKDVAEQLYSGAGSLTLGLSSRYQAQLARSQAQPS